MNKYIRKILRAAILLSVLSVSACKDSPTNIISTTPDFSVKVTLKSSNGQPVPGIAVSFCNDTDSLVFQKMQSTMLAKTSTGSTSVEFSVAESSFINLALYELDGRLLQDQSFTGFLGRGLHIFVIPFNATNVGTRVYKCVERAVNDTTKQVLFADSIYLTYWNTNPRYSILGITSNQGVFETTDSLSFPSVLSLPPMVETYENGPAPEGVFSFPQSVVITLLDTTSSQSVRYVRQIQKGQNEFSLIWAPSASSLPSRNEARSKIMQIPQNGNLSVPWALFQNFPNPFPY